GVVPRHRGEPVPAAAHPGGRVRLPAGGRVPPPVVGRGVVAGVGGPVPADGRERRRAGPADVVPGGAANPRRAVLRPAALAERGGVVRRRPGPVRLRLPRRGDPQVGGGPADGGGAGGGGGAVLLQQLRRRPGR